jgi:hypothetical protein
MRSYEASAFSVWLVLSLVTLASNGQEKKPPTLDDDLKALQGKWGTPAFSLTFGEKLMRLDLGGDAGAAFSFTLEEKNQKRYIVFDESDVKPLPNFPRAVAYKVDGKQLILTVEEEGKKILSQKELKLPRAGKGKAK